MLRSVIQRPGSEESVPFTLELLQNVTVGGLETFRVSENKKRWYEHQKGPRGWV